MFHRLPLGKTAANFCMITLMAVAVHGCGQRIAPGAKSPSAKASIDVDGVTADAKGRCPNDIPRTAKVAVLPTDMAGWMMAMPTAGGRSSSDRLPQEVVRSFDCFEVLKTKSGMNALQNNIGTQTEGPKVGGLPVPKEADYLLLVTPERGTQAYTNSMFVEINLTPASDPDEVLYSGSGQGRSGAFSKNYIPFVGFARAMSGQTSGDIAEANKGALARALTAAWIDAFPG